MFKLQAFEPVTTPVVFLLYLLGLYNMTIALLPLIRNKDEITDIPLTPAQRALLGLNPNATPPLAPGTQYTTPPRYPPSPTPRHVSPITSSPNGLGSPISRSPSFGRERSASPSASPLWQKTVSRGQVLARKSSSGTPSPLGPGIGMRDVSSVLGTPNTPSPTAGRGATVGLNNKWLYQKGRASSGSGGIDLFR